ncbi:MAG: hypothetical protein ACRDJU_02275 [Actinomycetota bacterium]
MTPTPTDNSALFFATSGPLPAAANSSYTYSPAKRISAQTQQGQASSFGYDPAGRLQGQDVNEVTTTYAYLRHEVPRTEWAH